MTTHKKRITAFKLLLLFSTFLVQSQSRVSWATDSDDLPQNSIKSIAPDKYGFIWMSTENGLVRYDGKDFEIFNSQNIGIKNNRLFYIIGNAKKDSLYINTDVEDDYILINRHTAKKIDPAKFPKARQYVRGITNIPFTANGIPSVLFGLPKMPYKIPLPSEYYYVIANDTISFYNPEGKIMVSQHFEYESNARFFSFGETLFYLKDNGDYARIDSNGVLWKHLDISIGAEGRLIWNIISQQVFIYSKNNVYTISAKNDALQKSLLITGENLIADNVGPDLSRYKKRHSLFWKSDKRTWNI
ncbi:two-component regulator propeller domain-containing protein [Flavobacterium sp. 3HN19-14]|uniref:two-component regulator propeller domain-containing protein n=1 Tax=Flavobacterium sp. 3HN19-14 TaxID=3448133 RepID=UPI003EDEBF60